MRHETQGISVRGRDVQENPGTKRIWAWYCWRKVEGWYKTIATTTTIILKE